MGRFDEVTQKLKQSQQDITTSLISKGCEIGGGSVAKFSEVSTYIDSIKSGGGYYILVKTDSNSGYVGGKITATKGELSVTGNIENQQCKLEVPEAGVWNIKSSNTASSITSVTVLDTFEGSLTCTCSATLKVSYSTDGGAMIDNYYQLFNPDGSEKIKTTINTQYPYEYNQTYSLSTFGRYRLYIHAQFWSKAHELNKYISVTDNKEYSISFSINTSRNGYIHDPNNLDQPSIGDEPPVNQEVETKSSIYAVNTTDMTESQIDEIFNHIDEMIQQNKTQSEIEDYIASKEQEYSNSI